MLGYVVAQMEQRGLPGQEGHVRDVPGLKAGAHSLVVAIDELGA